MPRGINLLLLLTALVGGATAQTPPPIDAWERCDGFISSGGNIPGYPAYMTLRDARAACASIPSCRGFTYSGSPDPDTATDVWLKDKWDCNPDGGWGAFKKPPVDAWERCDGFISSGGNIPGYEGAQMTLRDARAACASIPGCRGFTYSGSPDPDTATDVWLKDKWDCNPDGGWGAFKKPPVDAWERCDGFISSGGNIPGYEGAQMTLRDARAACASIPGCRGFTYSGSPDPDTATGVWLKDKWDCNPDGGWGAFKKPEGAGASGCVNRFGNGLDWTAIPYKRLGTDSPWGLVDDCTQQNVSPYGAYLCGVRGPAGDITNCPGDCQAGQCVSGPSGTWERCTGFISAGGNVPGYQGVKLTPNEAQATCASLPSCIGYTYTGSGGADDRTNVWLKEKWDCVQNGGSPPPLYTSVLVKGKRAAPSWGGTCKCGGGRGHWYTGGTTTCFIVILNGSSSDPPRGVMLWAVIREIPGVARASPAAVSAGVVLHGGPRPRSSWTSLRCSPVVPAQLHLLHCTYDHCPA